MMRPIASSTAATCPCCYCRVSFRRWSLSLRVSFRITVSLTHVHIARTGLNSTDLAALTRVMESGIIFQHVIQM